VNIFYRGYVIQRDPWVFGYTIFGRRPLRAELAMCGSSIEAMQWVDHRLADNSLIPSIRAAASDQLALI
jgi:hypothetical protein